MNAASALLRRPRGVALIEALVALAVMAIGMLGLVGVQSTLRSNSDIAKQRSEAVRLAQEAIEEWRGFAVLDSTAGVIDYADLLQGVTTDATITGINATYTRTRTVQTMSAPRVGKALTVDVTWADRSGQPQSVRLATSVTGIAPELAATLTVPGDGTPIRQPKGRNRGIPLQAKDLGNGTSGLKQPGAASTVVWRFDNLTGLITICSTALATTTTTDLTTANVSCSATPSNAQLLAGFLRYALATATPNPLAPLDAPPVAALTVSVNDLSATLLASCFVDTTTYTSYYCAVPVAVASVVQPWSGRLAFGGAIATSATDNSPSRIRICRYFDLSPAVLPGGNYTSVTTPMINQNYLAISAGDGTSAYSCPSGTALHQPV